MDANIIASVIMLERQGDKDMGDVLLFSTKKCGISTVEQ